MATQVKQVWKIHIYETRFQKVIFESVYTFKAKAEYTHDQINTKIRKDFKKTLKNKRVVFDFKRVK